MKIFASMIFEIRQDVIVQISRKQGDFVIFAIKFVKKPWPGEPIANGRMTYADGCKSQDYFMDLRDLCNKLQNWIETP